MNWLLWVPIVGLLVAALVFAGCGVKPPSYLCRLTMSAQGETALFCAPLPAGTMPKDAT